MNQPVDANGKVVGKRLLTSRAKLLTLIAIVAVPIVLAYTVMFVKPEWIPSSTTNQGMLIQPPIESGSIDGLNVPATGNWVMLLLGDKVVMDPEMPGDMFYLTRQVRTGLGKDANRVERMFLNPAILSERESSFFAREHKDLRIVTVDEDTLKEMTGPLNLPVASKAIVLIMDPNGNIMMYYPLSRLGKPMLKDLKHLLKISNIG